MKKTIIKYLIFALVIFSGLIPLNYTIARAETEETAADNSIMPIAGPIFPNLSSVFIPNSPSRIQLELFLQNRDARHLELQRLVADGALPQDVSEAITAWIAQDVASRMRIQNFLALCDYLQRIREEGRQEGRQECREEESRQGR